MPESGGEMGGPGSACWPQATARAESPHHGRETGAPRAACCSTAQSSITDRLYQAGNRSVIDNGCTACLSLARGTRRVKPMWRPPGAIPSCCHTPGCGALRAPHPGLCMVRPSGPNLADLATCFVRFGPKTTIIQFPFWRHALSGSGRKPPSFNFHVFAP